MLAMWTSVALAALVAAPAQPAGGLELEPGACTCRVTVTDPARKASNSLTVKFEVLKREFAIVAVYCSHDEAGAITAPTTGLVGQTLFAQFTIASFQRDPKSKQPI